MAVDARARQLTMDRSLASLPPALQSLSLYEYPGELVDGNRGLIEFADLLKRPLEAYKYLLGTVEHGRVSLDAEPRSGQLFIGSSNEMHLSAFKEIPEFQSFKGRMELVRVPYLLDYHGSSGSTTSRSAPLAVGKHVAPHAAFVAALWAVLTRMRKPLPENTQGADRPRGKLSRWTRLCCTPMPGPDGLTPEQTRELLAGYRKDRARVRSNT